MRIAAIIVAAGAGARAGEGPPKQWRPLGGRPVLRWSAEALLAAGVSPLIVVVPVGDEARTAECLAGLEGWACVNGGATRAESVQAGLAALAGVEDAAAVLVHDAARPFVAAHHLVELTAALANHEGAIPALAVADTLKRRAPAALETVSRANLWRAQTPQAFRLGALRAAYAAWPADAGEPTDDAVVVERAGGRVALAAGDPMLMKLTYPEDFTMAEALAAQLQPAPALATRIGQGFDAHRFGPGEAVMLCGVSVPHDQGLIGHSDADVGLHALTDALLGAVGEGDIGDHFPPTDPRWKGADSTVFLRHAADIVAAKGGRIVNVDVTLICERPKVKPHREAMRAKLAELLELPLDRVSVKATTTEEMGFTGRREGMAAQAIVSVLAPG
ncbi:MAG: bifunctional 2-C-methyl-D-erythritol 4-phosphate cytidylyltransferase/2-C-methyl-D-erythritol 2,4-cyclodiphosphate synthase [Caulobacteraceae bacterium]|nr:bifunctional 2-C-methyl-D-erythritol 4-phosphate cytidylyltransferase/2-C-methyl-D-erythritol 2,4-cyclodiphosphate synthase [Caulobacteraceae bacterium]